MEESLYIRGGIRVKKKVFVLLLFMLLLCCTCALAGTVYINGDTADRVHLRSAAFGDSESVGLFFNGTFAETVGTEGDWTRVNLGAMTGYIMSRYLQESWNEPAGYSGILKVSTLNLRAQPSMQAKVLMVLDETDAIVVWGEVSNGWYYVQCGDVLGYVKKEYLTLAEMLSSAKEPMKVGWAQNGYGIFRWYAPNGQEILFTALEDDPWVKYEDVNFDGHNDVVITTVRGASNFWVEFYVWQDGQYVYANQAGVYDGLCNYMLYPELGLVYSGANNGNAGALHANKLFRWNGTQLQLLRSAVSEDYVEMVDTPEGFSMVYDLSRLHVRVWDYSVDKYGGTLVYETVFAHDQLQDGESYQRLFAGEQEAFWKGLR